MNKHIIGMLTPEPGSLIMLWPKLESNYLPTTDSDIKSDQIVLRFALRMYPCEETLRKLLEEEHGR
jgi:hypothetical protein